MFYPIFLDMIKPRSYLLIFIFIPIYVLFFYQTQPVIQSSDQIYGLEFEFSCEPIFQDQKQFTVEIENETYPKRVPLFYNSSINFACLNKNRKKPVILFWNPFFSDPFYGFQNQSMSVKIDGCPVTNCEATIDKLRIDESSLVVTHMRDSFNISSLSNYRPASWRTVFLIYESPFHTPRFPHSEYKNFYNLTSTYKLDSDFPHFYEKGLHWKENTNFDKDFDFHGAKTKFAAALISNCDDSKSGRLEYIRRLKLYVPVDVYGKCGDHECPANGDCRAFLAAEYKFFLAFENSICDGYITEKFFHTLRYNSIPVVHGGGQYEQIVSALISLI